METPHGQAFFSGLKEDSFSKGDQRWVERPNKDMITKVGIDMKPFQPMDSLDTKMV